MPFLPPNQQRQNTEGTEGITYCCFSTCDLDVIVSNDLSATAHVVDVVSRAHKRAELIL